MYQDKNITVNGEWIDKSLRNLKIGKRTNWFPEVTKEFYHHYSRENEIVRRLILGEKLLRRDKSIKFASDESCHCDFTSPILDSSCFKLHFYVVQ